MLKKQDYNGLRQIALKQVGQAVAVSKRRSSGGAVDQVNPRRRAQL